MKNMTLKRVNKLYVILLLIGVAMGIVGVLAKFQVLTLAAILILAVDVVFRIACFRCPRCGHYLNSAASGWCPYCNKKLEPDEK